MLFGAMYDIIDVFGPGGIIGALTPIGPPVGIIEVGLGPYEVSKSSSELYPLESPLTKTFPFQAWG